LIAVDATAGPIVLEEGVAIGPLCYLKGPIYVERRARIVEHAVLKDCVSVGRASKVGGEVEASIIEPYTNKQHHGFLGHSYLGSWVNLGAGTCNSDLKNTYGDVSADYQGTRTATGMQFFGAVLGDYTKTAINTSIFTGKTIGACSMLYGFITSNVPSFVNYARTFGQVTELPPAVMETSQQRMFERRNILQRPSDIQLLHDMYVLTHAQRQLPSETPNF
jgi:glucose-1-phosphate thymidylyltransferase